MSDLFPDGQSSESQTPKLMNRIAQPLGLPVDGITPFPFMQNITDIISKPKRTKKNKEPKAKILPPELECDAVSSNQEYKAALLNQALIIKPIQLGFLPANYWVTEEYTFGNLVTGFFQKKNNSNCRFPHKLFNGLLLVQKQPHMYPLIGLMWITDNIFKVDKYVFGRLLGITTIDGGLMHSQGNFPSHGFKELSSDDVLALKKAGVNLDDVDFDRIRLMTHPNGKFTQSCTEEVLHSCKWQNE